MNTFSIYLQKKKESFIDLFILPQTKTHRFSSNGNSNAMTMMKVLINYRNRIAFSGGRHPPNDIGKFMLETSH
jgi:hypothetical protein